jgi:hypothetical protein
LELQGDTYQQTYSGKNLWPIRRENQTVGQVAYTYNQDGTFSLSGDPTGGGAVKVIVPLASSGITPGQTYTIWTDHGIGWGENQVMYYIQSCKADGTWVDNIAIFTNAARTQTVANTDEQYIMFVLSWSANGNYTNFNNVKTQLVAGSTADSDFEPYVGGIPAPNPDYPQEVQTVTGEQTVTVTGSGGVSQSYTIDLGSIELCKIGDYQDYIYKGADGWYLHKEIRHLSLPIADMDNGDNYPGWKNQGAVLTDLPAMNNGLKIVTHYYCNITGYDAYTGSDAAIYASNIGSGLSAGGLVMLLNTGLTQTQLKDRYQNLVVEVYYGIVNPIADTKITDTTLIGQLDALGAMRLFIGENNLLVSATGTNLPATLEFSYPTKFAKIGAEWEEGGTKGATIVDVNAIDNTYPVWELMGPAVNPTISVLTTNTTLTYNGTITASQKLVIDMFNKTATLNGTSVIGNVSGDFVYMAPGTNRIAYTAGNTDAPDSTIYWQEVVG